MITMDPQSIQTVFAFRKPFDLHKSDLRSVSLGDDTRRVPVPRDNPEYYFHYPSRLENKPWFFKSIGTMYRYLHLPENWDSYQANKIRPKNVLFALRVLDQIMLDRTPSPVIVATPEGSVQFEWRTRKHEIEVDVLDNESLDVYFENHETGKSWDRVISFVRLDDLKKIIRDLSDQS